MTSQHDKAKRWPHFCLLCVVAAFQGCMSRDNPKHWTVEKIELWGNKVMAGGEFGNFDVDVVAVKCTKAGDVIRLLYEPPLPDDLTLNVGDCLDFGDSLAPKSYDHTWDGYWIQDITVRKTAASSPAPQL